MGVAVYKNKSFSQPGNNIEKAPADLIILHGKGLKFADIFYCVGLRAPRKNHILTFFSFRAIISSQPHEAFRHIGERISTRLGMKAMTAPHCLAKIAVPETYFSFPEALRDVIVYFSLYHLQIVLLTIANKNALVFQK